MKRQDFNRLQAVADQDERKPGPWIRRALIEKLAQIEAAQSKTESA